jgi:hypothetical protein
MSVSPVSPSPSSSSSVSINYFQNFIISAENPDLQSLLLIDKYSCTIEDIGGKKYFIYKDANGDEHPGNSLIILDSFKLGQQQNSECCLQYTLDNDGVWLFSKPGDKENWAWGDCVIITDPENGLFNTYRPMPSSLNHVILFEGGPVDSTIYYYDGEVFKSVSIYNQTLSDAFSPPIPHYIPTQNASLLQELLQNIEELFDLSDIMVIDEVFEGF